MKFKTKIDNFGRIVIPKKIRDEFGILKSSEIEINTTDNDEIILKPGTSKPFIKNKDGVLVVCSEPIGSLEDIIDRDREERIRKILKDIEI
ncbi:AbrB/MazE/SpoVT family DNA-binding domain-containing protein [Actinomycetota bacterium]